MIHLQNKGERLEDIIFGLHVGNARNYISTIVSNRLLDDPILFIGGLSLNDLQVRAFKVYFPKLVVPEHNTSVGAIGVALQALESGVTNRLDMEKLRSMGGGDILNLPIAPRLTIRETFFPEENEVRRKLSGKKFPVYLGIDIGSTRPSIGDQ
jgi:activator of 2-hydroxyglutaryl-CoA dehydratase